MSLPSTSASAPWAGDKSGNGGVYLTPKVETLEWAQAEGLPPTCPAVVRVGNDPSLEASVADFERRDWQDFDPRCGG